MLSKVASKFQKFEFDSSWSDKYLTMPCIWLTVSKLLKKLATEMIKNDQHLIFTKTF